MRSTARRLGGVLCAALTLSSCATAPPPPSVPELPVPPERIVQKGYSVVPPNENGWRIMGRDPVRLSLAKGATILDATAAIQATLFRLHAYRSEAEFVRLIKEGQAKGMDPQRFKILRHEVTALPGKGTDCARSYMVAEDEKAVTRAGLAGPMILELLTLSCAHPKDRSLGVDVGYSARYQAGERDPAFLDKGGTVINSVEFTAF